MVNDKTMKWHRLDEKDIFTKCDTRIERLSPSEVEERLERFGYNRLPEKNGCSSGGDGQTCAETLKP